MRAKGFILFIVVLYTVMGACTTNKVVTEKSNTKDKKQVKALNKEEERKYYLLFIEANRKKILGDIEGASSLYYQCLEINPGSAAAMYEISKINEYIKNYSVAIKYAENTVKIEPENKWYQVNLAGLYASVGELDKAIEVYKTLIESNEQNLEYKYTLANLYIQKNEYNEAIRLLDEIENVVGVNEKFAITKQKLYLQLGNKTKAYNEVKNLIKHFPNNPSYYGILAEMYTNDNLFTKAEEYYNKLFKIDSTNILGQLSIIDFYRKKMDYKSAFNAIEKVIRNNEIEYDDKVLILVSILNNKSEFNICNRDIKDKVLLLKDLYPEKKDGYTLYADYLIKMNQFDAAENEIEYILNNFSGNIVLWEQLLSIYSYNGKFNELYIKSKTAIDSFPEHASFYLFNGVAATQKNMNEEAVSILKEGLKRCESNKELELDFYTHLGESYYELKDYKKSDYYFDLVLAEDPDNLYVINNYSYYLALREEKLEYAQRISKKTIEEEPDNSTYLDTYAWVLFKLKKYQDAYKYIKQAYENGGAESPVIVEHYGDIEYMLGNKGNAVKMWELSSKIGNNSEVLKEKIKRGQYIKE